MKTTGCQIRSKDDDIRSEVASCKKLFEKEWKGDAFGILSDSTDCHVCICIVPPGPWVADSYY